MIFLIFIHSLHSGGAERVTANLANHWARKGWRVTVVTLAPIDSDFYKLHSSVHRITLDVESKGGNLLAGLANNIARLRSLRRVLKQVNPDVALAMMSTANILLALAATGLNNIKTIGSERTHPPRMPLGKAWEFLRAWSYGRLHSVVALTEESATWLRENTRAPHTSVIPNAACWPLQLQEPYLDLPVRPTGQRWLIAAGRLVTSKGFDLLISVFQRLAPDYPDWHLIILGEGPERCRLQAQISSNNLDNCISLPGQAGNIAKWYEAADIYVMTSLFEGFPNTLVEAMAHGLPAVSFDCDTGPRDIIRHEIDGLLVRPGDIAALEVALRQLMNKEITRKQFSERAMDVRDRFSTDHIASMWENLYRSNN